MKITLYVSFLCLALLSITSCKGQTTSTQDSTPETVLYTYKSGDPNGMGKWYMGRQIAHVMGFQGINWLERSEREEEENTTALLKNMDIQPDDVIADIGAGSGYHVFKMASLAQKGTIYAVDIQDEMVQTIIDRKNAGNISQVEPILGSSKDVRLPENSVDKILMVDVYHEFDFPVEMVASMRIALKRDGKIYLIEYRGEDDTVPIKKVHKMTEAQAIKEMEAAGFTLEKNIANLPWQHCMVFRKK